MLTFRRIGLRAPRRVRTGGLASIRHREDGIGLLVRRYLRAGERFEHIAQILAGVRSRESRAERRGLRGVSMAALGSAAKWSAGVAAAALMRGFLWPFRRTSAHADKIKLVREAHDVLGESHHDRLYRVQFDLQPGMAKRSPVLAELAAFDCQLWTRADRFWLEGKRADRVWALGRDNRHHTWLAAASDTGLDFPPEDIPEVLDDALDMFSFDLETVLHLMATEFDLTVLRNGLGGASNTTVICGTPRAKHSRPRLRSVTIEIDHFTKIVRRVVFSRLRHGILVADVSFTFDRSENHPDSAYLIAGHLGADAMVLSSDQRLTRRRELLRFFGSLSLKLE
jgi:hypothetical protein